MPKNLLQDMVKVKRSKLKIKEDSPRVSQKITPTLDSRNPQNEKRKVSRYIIWCVAFISATFLFFAVSYMLGKVTVVLSPKTQELILNKNLSANKDAGENALAFDLVVISGEENKIMQTTETKEVSEKAEGTVVLYNTFSSSPQTLNIDTRLEGSNGKIYKTKTRSVVPGMSKDKKPGSVEVKIYGSEGGEEYNSVPLDFKILNFKGSPKYSKFYGRSKGAITGGFKGGLPIISDTDKTNTVSELKTILQAKLLKKATDQIPNGFILFKNAVFLNTEDDVIDTTSITDNMLPIKLKGTLYGLLFNENQLTKIIIEDNVEGYDGSEVYLSNIKDLIFSLLDKNSISSADIKSINFNLSGAVKVVWKLDEAKFIDDLLGKSKKDFSQILLQYPNIDSADLVISPIWRMSIPDNIEDIKVIVNYPK